MEDQNKHQRTHADRYAETMADEAASSGAWEKWQQLEPLTDVNPENHGAIRVVNHGHLSLMVSSEAPQEQQQPSNSSERLKLVK